ncbi:MAG: hypothetical protein INF43_03325 [Alphaproteobacteria bacterium]|nr:hypothetical protein [Alphaproteobacteria bacterium]
MSLYVVSRRKVVFHQPSLGTVQVVYVPSADQTQVLKDAAGTAQVAKPAAGGAALRGPQLARVQRGQRTLYGTLPTEILELRQAVKVWLPEDLAPPEAEAFFYVLSPQVVIHGIRERNDEGRLVWRTAQLQLPAGEAAMPALQLILADFSLANPGQNVCLAVVNDVALYRTIQQGQQAHGFPPIPFSTLKPAPDLAPLYSHQNFTWLYLLLLLLGAAAVAAVAIFWMAEKTKGNRLQAEIEAVEAQIRAVQINKRTGHIRQPDAVLNELTTGVAVSPSALIQATAQVGQRLGDVQQIALARDTSLDTDAGVTLTPELQPMQILLNNPVQSLLLDQANIASGLLPQMPWVRQVIRQGQPGDAMMELAVIVQVTGTVPLAASAMVSPATAIAPAAAISATATPTPTEAAQ